MSETDEEAERVLAPLAACPIADRAVAHEHGLTTVEQENEAQAAQNPEDHRYAVDCTWTDARAAELAPHLRALWSELPTEHSFSIWYGWAPSRPLPDMAFSVEGHVYIASYAIWSDPADDERHRSWVVDHTTRLATLGKGVYLGDTDFTRRPDRFLGARELPPSAGDPGAPGSGRPVLLLPDRRRRGTQRRTRPPSAHSVCPVIAPAASDTRKATAAPAPPVTAAIRLMSRTRRGRSLTDTARI